MLQSLFWRFYSVPPFQAPRVSEWASDPLRRDSMLPSIAMSQGNLPTALGEVSYRLNGYFYLVAERLYPLAIYFVISTLCAIVIAARPVRYGVALYLAIAIPIVAMAGFKVTGRLSLDIVVGLGSLMAAVQARAMHGLLRSSICRRSMLPPQAKVRLFACFALSFFGLIWISWQIESGSPRHARSYLPFLAMIIFIGAEFWADVLVWNDRTKSAEIPRSLRC